MPDDDPGDSERPVEPVAEVRRSRRIPVATLLNTAGVMAAAVVVAALEPKFPERGGD